MQRTEHKKTARLLEQPDGRPQNAALKDNYSLTYSALVVKGVNAH